MSFEGYYEAICNNGHRYTFDCYEIEDYLDENPKCDCGSHCVFCNMVDTTNGPADGKISEEGWKSILISPEESQTCNLGHIHVTSRAVYGIPTKKEMEKFRVYYDDEYGF